MASYKTAERRVAIERGMHFIYAIAQKPRHFSRCSDDLLYFFYHVALTARDRTLREMARNMGEESFSRWRNRYQDLPANADVDTIIDYFHADSTAEQFGLRNKKLKQQIRGAAKHFTAGDFLWFDPLKESPPWDVPELCDHCDAWNARGRKRCSCCRHKLTMMTRYQVWYYSLIRAYCAAIYGIVLGANYADVLRWLPTLRPYPKPSRNGDNTDFADSIYAISHIVYTLNDYGKFRLSPSWLPEEYEFLKSNVKQAIALDDPDMTGEILDSLMAFGLDDRDRIIKDGIDYLLACQNPEGSWGDRDTNDLYCKYHPTWSAIDGLREFAWRGERVKFPSVLPMLKQWATGKVRQCSDEALK